MTLNRPRISVLMNVYNGEKYLRETIDSILSQTFGDYEFIMIDDGSTDGTADILNSYHDARIKIIKNSQNIGISYSLNKGISLARGEYIAHTDCDDLSSPDRLLTQVQFLDNNSTIDVVGSWAEIIDQNNNPTGEIWKYSRNSMGLRWLTLFTSPVAHSAVMIRSRVLDRFGRYDVAYDIAVDYGLWASLNLNILFSNIQQPLIKYRVHENSISNSRQAKQFETSCRISQKMISSYLNRNIDYETIRLIKSPYPVNSKKTYAAAIDTLHQLHKKFQKDHHLRPAEAVYIYLKFSKRYGRMAYHNLRLLFSGIPGLYAILMS